MHDRELSLLDGSRLLRHDRFDEIMQREGIEEDEMTRRLGENVEVRWIEVRWIEVRWI